VGGGGQGVIEVLQNGGFKLEELIADSSTTNISSLHDSSLLRIRLCRSLYIVDFEARIALVMSNSDCALFTYHNAHSTCDNSLLSLLAMFTCPWPSLSDVHVRCYNADSCRCKTSFDETECRISEQYHSLPSPFFLISLHELLTRSKALLIR
jgi:hypothetical protein